MEIKKILAFILILIFFNLEALSLENKILLKIIDESIRTKSRLLLKMKKRMVLEQYLTLVTHLDMPSKRTRIIRKLVMEQP